MTIMMTKRWPLMGAAVAAIGCGQVMGQTGSSTRTDKVENTGLPTNLRIQRASDLIGKNVKNAAGENLGEINDVTIEPERGRVVYAVVGFGGFLGMGEKLFAIPMSSFTLPGEAKHIILNVDKDRLKNAQGFDKDRWPDMADRTWATGVYTYYGQKPYWDSSESESAPLRWQKASDLIRKDVKNTAGDKVGEIEDLAIDPDRSRVVYAVVAYGGTLGVGEKWIAIPMQAMTLPKDAKHFVLDVDKDRLKNAEGFDKKQWPNMADASWAVRVHTYYNQRPYWEGR